ncbi:phage tail protein [Bacillus mesophilum]|uniref:phage tail protein n=1 Tax=Bacillus mesophilum TaxID=1071718 RepID=UPI001375AA3A|nr:phage tail protein [Bacillus mesophilum]
MLVITDLQGNTEPAINFNGLEINEEVNGDFSLSCTFLRTEHNRHAWPLIAEESLIEHDGHEFRIKNINKGHSRKPVSARHIFFDLIGHHVYSINGGTKTPGDAFSFILDGSGWTFEVVDNIPAALLPNFGEDNAISLIRTACIAFNCEIKIMPGKHIQIYKQIGKDEDHQFRYNHNIKTINENVNTDNLFTSIRGFGGNGLEVTYVSPNASKFPHADAADPVRDEEITEAETMTEMLKQTLIDYPEVSIELEAIMLEGAELGDKVWLIHEPLGIEFQTRIMVKKSRPQSPSGDTVTLGNRRQQMSDLLTETKIEIKENQKQVQSRIEQTNERIALEVEALNEGIAAIQLEYDNVSIRVEEFENSLAQINTRADNILLSVADLGDEIDAANAQISIQAGLISSKVEQRDYNGNVIASLINQSADAVEIEANKINLNGITNVAETLTLGTGFGSYARINFNGNYSSISTDSGSGMVLSMSGNLTLDALNLEFFGTHVDLSTASRITWGNNGPTNAQYAANAGNAQTLNGYTASDFSRSGHTHSGYVRDAFSQGLELYIDNSTGRMVVRRNGSVLGAVPWA